MPKKNRNQVGGNDYKLTSDDFAGLLDYTVDSKVPDDVKDSYDVVGEILLGDQATGSLYNFDKTDFVFDDIAEENLSNKVSAEGKYQGDYNFSPIVNANDIYFEPEPDIRDRVETYQAPGPLDIVLSQGDDPGQQQALSAPDYPYGFTNWNRANHLVPYREFPHYNYDMEYKRNNHLESNGMLNHCYVDVISPSFQAGDDKRGNARAISAQFNSIDSHYSNTFSEQVNSHDFPNNKDSNDVPFNEKQLDLLNTENPKSAQVRFPDNLSGQFYPLSYRAQLRNENRSHSSNRPHHNSFGARSFSLQSNNDAVEATRPNLESLKSLDSYFSCNTQQSRSASLSTTADNESSQTHELNAYMLQPRDSENLNSANSVSCSVQMTNEARGIGWTRSNRTTSDALQSVVSNISSSNRSSGNTHRCPRYNDVEKVVLIGLVNEKWLAGHSTLHEMDWIDIQRRYHQLFESRPSLPFSGRRTWRALKRFWKKLKTNRQLSVKFMSACIARYKEIIRA